MWRFIMKNIKEHIQKRYAKFAKDASGCGCGCCSTEETSKKIGYSKEDINQVPDANLGLGCGNPTALGELHKGETVLDLGSGAGFDAFLAAKKVGYTGKVIGVDMTPDMIKKAKENAKKYNYSNVEFRLGDIENLPIEDNSIDVIISNCVINLAPNKEQVFKEAYRVLKPKGRMYISDIVLLKELSKEQRQDPDLIASCIGGAILKDQYTKLIKDAGLRYGVISEKSFSNEFPVQSLNLRIYK
jgi:ArsR family transcriptional regulator